MEVPNLFQETSYSLAGAPLWRNRSYPKPPVLGQMKTRTVLWPHLRSRGLPFLHRWEKFGS